MYPWLGYQAVLNEPLMNSFHFLPWKTEYKQGMPGALGNSAFEATALGSGTVPVIFHIRQACGQANYFACYSKPRQIKCSK